jgi:hypothetical protein
LSGKGGELGQLGFLFFQLPLDFCDGPVPLLNLSGVLFTFLFRVTDVALRGFDQLGEFFRTPPVELNAAAVSGDFAFQSLYLCARLSDFDVNLVQRAAFFGERIFAVVDVPTQRILGLGQAFDFVVTASEISFESIKLLACVMSFNHAKIRMQRLVTPRFACLSLQ